MCLSTTDAAASRQVQFAHRLIQRDHRGVDQIILDREMFVSVKDKKGKIVERAINPAIKRHFEGPTGKTTAKAFIARAKQSDELRRALIDQGVDINEWEEGLQSG